MNGNENLVDNLDGNIVSLGKRDATLRSKILVDTLDYWNDLRSRTALPRRAEIDPRRIEGALPYAFILERTTPALARFRVAGGHLNDLMGMDVRGMPISALFDDAQRDHLLELVEEVFTTPSTLELALSARVPGAEVKTAELLILPMTDDEDRVTRALGCLVSRGPVVQPPYHFRIDQTRRTRVAHMVDGPAPVAPTQKARPMPLRAFAAPETEYTPQTPKGARVRSAPHLRVVK